MITVEQFHSELVRYRDRHPSQRYGQAVFNLMYEIAPVSADLYRGTLIDPFHNNGVAARFISACLEQ
jgi:hypothetical protein